MQSTRCMEGESMVCLPSRYKLILRTRYAIVILNFSMERDLFDGESMAYLPLQYKLILGTRYVIVIL
jgi:hypothetical protein